MNRIINILAIYAMIILCACAVFAQKTGSSDEALIRQNVEQMVSGWNAKSAADYVKSFAEDADFVVINGSQLKGRAAIEKGHQQIFEIFFKDANIAAAVEQIRFVRPDVAIVHLSGERFPKNDRSQTIKSRITVVMVKNKDKWEIAAFQNTQIQPPAAAQGGK